MTMPNEEVNTPSADVQTSDASAQSQSSDEQTDGSSPGWWQRLFNRRPAQETTSDSGDPATSESGPSKSLTVSQEELDRRVQAETDRRESKRQQEARVAQRRRLRDEDPWAYAEQERQAEQHADSTGALENFLTGVGSEHDRVSIDPVMDLVSKEERDRILKIEGAGRGLAGRKLVVSEALKSLERQWKAAGEREAESRLRRNPAFRKQVLTEGRTGLVEPDLLPSVSSSAADSKVADILRRHYGVGSGR